MENGIFVSLKLYVNDNVEYSNRLLKAYFDKEITIREIIDYRENGLAINTYGMNDLGGRLYNEGTDIDSAQNLFLVAMEHGCHNGKYNYACCLVFKKNLELERAIQLFSEVASQKSHLDSVDYCIGMAYLQLKDYVSAYRHFKRVPEKEGGKDNIHFLSAKEKMISVLKIILDQSFTNVDRKQGKNKPWYSVVDDFDGFDAYDESGDILYLKKLRFEYKLAKTEELYVKQQLETEKSKGKESQPGNVEALRKRLEVAETKRKDKKGELTLFRLLKNDDKTAKKKERRRQVQTEKHFFSTRRTRSNQTKTLATELQLNRLVQKQEEVRVVDATGIPSRRLITADLATFRASLAAGGRTSDYVNFSNWHVARTEEKKGKYGNYYQHYGNTETVKLGKGLFHYYNKVNPHGNHIGDFYCTNLDDYEIICGKLRWIAGSLPAKLNKKNEMVIANWMLRYSKSGTEVSLEELRSLQPDSGQKDLEYIMRIFFLCFIKEPMRWMTPAVESNELPFATAQSRAVRLIAEGFLSLEQVFDQYSPYGIYTGKKSGENIDSVWKKIDRINKLYKECILTKENQNFQPYFHFMREHVMGEIVTSREHLHQELIDTYGGDQDSDGEGYTSDNAEDLYPSIFKF